MLILNADYSNIDYEDMANKIGLKVKHMPMLIGSFVDESSSIMSNLKTSIESKDFDNIKLFSHSIKGSAANLKFDAIYEMAKEMELSAIGKNETFNYLEYFEVINSAIKTIK